MTNATAQKEMPVVIANHRWTRIHNSKPLDKVAAARFKARKSIIKNKDFLAACSAALVDPTPRQARKWNNGKGRAFLFRSVARKSS